MSTDLTDAQSLYQLVGSIVDRRDGRELRTSLRLPLDGIHTEYASHGCNFGSVSPEHAPGRSRPVLLGIGKSEERRTGADPANYLRIIDFSEGGLQVEFAGGNPIHIIRKAITLEVDKLRVPVAFRWYQPDRQRTRAGFVFGQRISSSLDTATLAVRLSDMLLDGLTSELFQMPPEDKYHYCYYVFLVLLSNLRLKLLQSVAHYLEVQSSLGNAVDYSSAEKHIYRMLRYHEAFSERATLKVVTPGDSSFKDLIRTFMIPYSRYGCAVITKEDSPVLLQKEIVRTLARSVIIPSGKHLSTGNITTRLRSAYAYFMRLHSVVPEMFRDIEADMQLMCYSNTIDSIDRMTEKAIDRFLVGSRSF